MQMEGSNRKQVPGCKEHHKKLHSKQLTQEEKKRLCGKCEKNLTNQYKKKKIGHSLTELQSPTGEPRELKVSRGVLRAVVFNLRVWDGHPDQRQNADPY